MNAQAKSEDDSKATTNKVSKTSSDTARRAYRHVLDTMKNLDEINKRKAPLRDLFSAETVYYRNKLKDYCERLMFHSPLEYGRKSEELVWRKVFYEAIQSMKQFKKNTKLPKTMVTSYQLHLSAASGFYCHLLFKLQTEFKLDLDRHVDCHYETGMRALEPQSTRTVNAKIKGWAEKACHRCLLYLGDLARYQKDYDGNRSWVRAQRYYYQALALVPDNGMPHNQLGTLVGVRYYGLDAAYHYIRCMASSSKFQGASGNLKRVFEKNRKRYQELIHKASTDKGLSPEQQRVRDIKSFCVRFLHIMDILYNMGRNSAGADSKDLQSQCQALVQDFHFCLFHQQPDPQGPGPHSDQRFGEEKMTYMEDEMVFKVVVLITIVVHKLQSQGCKQVAAAIALNLAVFSHILNHTLTRLQTAFYEVSNLKSKPNEELGPAGDNITTIIDVDGDRLKRETTPIPDISDASSEEEEGVDAPTSRSLARLRRRRRRSGFSDEMSGEDESGPPEDTLSIMSEDEDDEEEMNFLTRQSSSESEDEPEADMMISQDFRPMDQHLEDSVNSNVTTASTLIDMQRNFGSSSASLSLHEILTGGMSNNYVGNKADLQQFSHDLLSGSGLDGVGTVEHDFKKNVRVPPGFDKDPEAQYVAEISHKLATFQIDTDTNSSIQTEDSADDTETETDSILDRTESRETQIDRVLSIIADEGLLCVIKVLCDWLIGQPQIINTCIQSSPLLWSRLSYFLNFLPLEFMVAKQDNFGGKAMHDHVSKLSSSQNPKTPWKQLYPLREDINLYKLSPMSESHSNIAFDQQLPLDSTEEAILRICCLRSFGYRMAAMSDGRFTYNAEKKIFCGPNVDSTNQDPTTQVQMEDLDARRNQLMKDMAQLRLQAEVSKMKNLVSTGMNRDLPPYLVPDASAILDKMNLIKQLVQSSKFIIIVPIAVIDQLDAQKKELAVARDSIRWLEAEFKNGNRFIRAQKAHEKQTAPQRNLRRKDRDAWQLLQVIDCCNYLSSQSPGYSPSGMASVLTNDNFQSPDRSVKVAQMAQKAQQQVDEDQLSELIQRQIKNCSSPESLAKSKPKPGIIVVQIKRLIIHNVTEFFNKWKEQWKKNG